MDTRAHTHTYIHGAPVNVILTGLHLTLEITPENVYMYEICIFYLYIGPGVGKGWREHMGGGGGRGETWHGEKII